MRLRVVHPHLGAVDLVGSLTALMHRHIKTRRTGCVGDHLLAARAPVSRTVLRIEQRPGRREARFGSRHVNSMNLAVEGHVVGTRLVRHALHEHRVLVDVEERRRQRPARLVPLRIEVDAEQAAALAQGRKAVGGERDRLHAAVGVDFARDAVTGDVDDDDRGRRRQARRVDETTIRTVGQVVGRDGTHLRTVERQDDLAPHGEGGVVDPLEDFGPLAVPPAGPVGRRDRRRPPVRGDGEVRVVADLELAEHATGIAVVQIDAAVGLVVERKIEEIRPVRRGRGQAGNLEMLGLERRWHGCRRADAKTQAAQGHPDTATHAPPSPLSP